VEEGTSDGSSSSSTVVRNPTVLYIDHHSYFDDEAQLVHLAWGGGPCLLLSASSRRCILVFSLLPYFSKLLRSDPAQHLLQPVLPSVEYAFVDLHRLSGDLLAADWTHDGQGLLYSDQNSMVSMLTVTGPGGLRPQGGQQQGPPTEEELQLLQLQELWKAHAEARHDLVAAGPSPMSPSATAGSESAQRLLVWWPSLHPGTGKVCIGAEVIRHPVRLQHMEWGPALEPAAPPVVPPAAAGSPTRHESPLKAFARSLSPTKHSAVPAPAPQYPPGADPSSGAGAAGAGAGAGGALPEAPQQPALMTLGADWVIRIWVEVVMSNMSAASPSQPSKPSQPMSQFCLSLVIEPPSLAISHAIRPGMAACWARHLNGTPRANGVHSNVLWLMANVSMYVQPAEEALDSEPGFRDILYLWAVDGLHSVVLSGLATSAVMHGSQAGPRAILWGQDSTSLGWHQPRRLLSRTAQRSLAVAVYYKRDVPMLVVGQQFCDPASCYSELRAFKLFPVSLERGTGGQREGGGALPRLCSWGRGTRRPCCGAPQSRPGAAWCGLVTFPPRGAPCSKQTRSKASGAARPPRSQCRLEPRACPRPGPQATPSAACASAATCRTTWLARPAASPTSRTTRTWTWRPPSAAGASWRCGAWRPCTAWTGRGTTMYCSSTSPRPGAAAAPAPGCRCARGAAQPGLARPAAAGCCAAAHALPAAASRLRLAVGGRALTAAPLAAVRAQVVQRRPGSYCCILATATACSVVLALVIIMPEQQHLQGSAGKMALQQVQQLASLELPAGTPGVLELLELPCSDSTAAWQELQHGGSYSTALLAVASGSQAGGGDGSSSSSGSSEASWLLWDLTVTCSAAGSLQVTAAKAGLGAGSSHSPAATGAITCLSHATGPALQTSDSSRSAFQAAAGAAAPQQQRAYLCTGTTCGLVQLWALGRQERQLLASLQLHRGEAWGRQERSSGPVAAVAACPGLQYLAALTSPASGGPPRRPGVTPACPASALAKEAACQHCLQQPSCCGSSARPLNGVAPPCAPAGESEGCLRIWRASEAGSQLDYQPELLLELDDTATALLWLQSAGLQRMLAVGYASGLVEVRRCSD
jgi:hypothetical protein